jgi:hypothetical protein
VKAPPLYTTGAAKTSGGPPAARAAAIHGGEKQKILFTKVKFIDTIFLPRRDVCSVQFFSGNGLK